MCNEWKEQTFLELTNYLQTLSDEKYKNFNDKIINTSYKTLGLRTPVLKKISKEIMKTNYLDFLTFANSSNIYEVQILSGLVISNMSDLKEYTKYIKNRNINICSLKNYISTKNMQFISPRNYSTCH